jgi:hypothetical protein
VANKPATALTENQKPQQKEHFYLNQHNTFRLSCTYMGKGSGMEKSACSAPLRNQIQLWERNAFAAHEMVTHDAEIYC